MTKDRRHPDGGDRAAAGASGGRRRVPFGEEARALLDSLGVAAIVLDRDGRAVYVTPEMERLLGDAEGGPVESLESFASSIAYDGIIDHVRDVLETAERVDLERDIRNGHDRWFFLRVTPFIGSDGRVERVAIVLFEITDRKRAEAEMEASRKFAEDTIESLAQPLLVLYEDLTVKESNPAFNEHFGVAPEETIGRKIYDLGNGQWDIPALRTLLEDVLPDDTVFNNYEVDHEFEDIGRRVMLMNARRLDHVQLILLGIDDITERAESKEALERAHAELERRVADRTEKLRQLTRVLSTARSRERKRLAAVLHDDLQQYLVALKMHLGTARQETDTRRAAEFIDKSIELADEAMRASRDLTQELRPPVLYEDGLLPAVRWLVEWMADHHELVVALDPGDFGTELEEDIREMLFESIRELLFNVVKHAEIKKAEVIFRESTDSVSVIVKDHGRGFDPNAVIRRKREGGGLGLFSMRERMEALGGGLFIHSVPGDGARVTIRVPKQSTPSMAIPPGVSPAAGLGLIEGAVLADRSSTSPRVRSVVIADDHVVVRQGIAHLLREDARVRVVGEASSGAEAIELAGKLGPDVVLMDVNMDELNGIEATRVIRGRFPRVHVVGLSVQDDPTTGRSMRDAGAKALLSKSDDAEAMVETILGLCPLEEEREDDGEREERM